MTEKISVIIPVYNEEKRIGPLIGHIRSVSDESVDIIVVDGNSAGNTIAAVDDGNVTKITAEKSRGGQMNAGAAAAKGDLLLFLHADTILPSDAFNLIRNALAKKSIAAGAFKLSIDSRNPFLRIISAATSLRSRITRVPYGDQAIFVKRHLFLRLGGYRELPLLEDVDLMERIKERGAKIAIIGTPVRTSARRWEKEGLFYCTLRNRLLMTLYTLGASPRALSRFYR